MFESAYNALKGSLVSMFTKSADPNQPKPAVDLTTDQSLAVKAVRDNDGLLGNATRAVINRNRDLDAAIDAATGNGPPPAPPKM
jgi:hypothetical protein